MLAIQIRAANPEHAAAQVALAEALGASVYKDQAGNTFVVAENGLTEEALHPNIAREAKRLRLMFIPDNWERVLH